jgi:WD40 repeat protein
MEHRTLPHLSTDAMLKAHQEIAQRQPITFQGHENTVYALAMLPDGRVVSGSQDETLKLWDIDKQQCLATLEGHRHTVYALAVLPDGRVVSGSLDKTLKLWDMNKQQCLATFRGHEGIMTALAVLPDGRVVSGSLDKTLKLWDMNKQQCLATFQGHEDRVWALAVLPDGRVVSGSHDKTLKLWDMNKQQCLATFSGHESGVRALAVLRDGRVLSSSDGYLAFKLWDMNKQQCLATFSGHDSVRALAVLPDGRVMSGSWDYTLKLWDMNKKQCLATLKGHENWVNALAVLPDGRVVSGSHDKTFKLWDVRLPTWALAAETPTVKSFNVPQRSPSQQSLPVNTADFSSPSFHQQFKADELPMEISTKFITKRSKSSKQYIIINPNNSSKVISNSRPSIPEGHNQFLKEDHKRKTGRKIKKSFKEAGIDRAHIVSDNDIQRNIVDDINFNFKDNQTESLIERIFSKIWREERDKLHAISLLEKLKKEKTLEGKVSIGNDLICYLSTYYNNISCGNANQNRAIGRRPDLDAPINEAGLHSSTYRTRGFLEGSVDPANTAYISSLPIRGNSILASRYGRGGREHKDDRNIDLENTTARTGNLLNQFQEIKKSQKRKNEFDETEEKNAKKRKTNELKFQKIPLEKLILENEPIGIGAFGAVYKGKWNGYKVACKEMIGQLTEQALKDFKREAGILANLNSPYIVRFFGICFNKTRQYLVMELCQESLFDRLQRKPEITWDVRIFFGKKIARGLAYLHEQEILHLDLAARNILLDEKGHPKITDFGISETKHYYQRASNNSNQGRSPIAWTALERLENTSMKPNTAIDIYSYGVVLWEIAARKLPLEGLKELRLTQQLLIKHIIETHYRDPVPKDTPGPFAKLIDECRDINPQRRPSAEQAIDRLKKSNYSPQFFQAGQQTQTSTTNISYQPMTKNMGQ